MLFTPNNHISFTLIIIFTSYALDGIGAGSHNGQLVGDINLYKKDFQAEMRRDSKKRRFDRRREEPFDRELKKLNDQIVNLKNMLTGQERSKFDMEQEIQKRDEDLRHLRENPKYFEDQGKDLTKFEESLVNETTDLNDKLNKIKEELVSTEEAIRATKEKRTLLRTNPKTYFFKKNVSRFSTLMQTMRHQRQLDSDDEEDYRPHDAALMSIRSRRERLELERKISQPPPPRAAAAAAPPPPPPMPQAAITAPPPPRMGAGLLSDIQSGTKLKETRPVQPPPSGRASLLSQLKGDQRARLRRTDRSVQPPPSAPIQPPPSGRAGLLSQLREDQRTRLKKTNPTQKKSSPPKISTLTGSLEQVLQAKFAKAKDSDETGTDDWDDDEKQAPPVTLEED